MSWHVKSIEQSTRGRKYFSILTSTGNDLVNREGYIGKATSHFTFFNPGDHVRQYINRIRNVYVLVFFSEVEIVLMRAIIMKRESETESQS